MHQSAATHFPLCLVTQRDASIKENRRSKWQEEKVLRVWTPPGYEKDSAPEGGWPVLYLNDGQVRIVLIFITWIPL